MRVLLDECVPRKVQRYIVDHECLTVPRAGFAGKKNGELLGLAEDAGFDVLLTVDKALPNQQSLTNRTICLLIIQARSNKLADLLPYLPACLEALHSIGPGQVVRIGA